MKHRIGIDKDDKDDKKDMIAMSIHDSGIRDFVLRGEVLNWDQRGEYWSYVHRRRL
jgi:hypothetical protein